MDSHVVPARALRGVIKVPPDKSISHRAVIFSSLAEGTSRVRNFLQAEDPLRTVVAFRRMGVDIEELPGSELLIHGAGLDGLREPDDVIDCGNSGTTTRLLMGILASKPFFSTLTGDASLRSRPMARVADPLRAAGAVIDGRAKGNRLPLSIRGHGFGPITHESQHPSAQVKTAILLAGLFRDGVSSVMEPVRSRDHTERMLPAYGVPVHIEGTTVSLRGQARLRPVDVTVPGDFSSAAFFFVAALLVPGSDLIVEQVGINQTRTGLLDVLGRMGADISLEHRQEVSGEPVADIRARYSPLVGTIVSGTVVPRMIDEFPIFCIAAAAAAGTTEVRDAAELRVKESDRIAMIASALEQLGVPVEERPDGLRIEGVGGSGPGAFSSGDFASGGDHRIAMASAVGALVGNGASTIRGTECIETSFPGFWDRIQAVQSGNPE